MDQLEEYIKSNLTKGYTKEQIIQYLVTQGYDEKTVRQIADKLTSSSSQNINPQLQNYVDQSLKQGYSKEQIESTLVTQGYNKDEVDSALGIKKNISIIKIFLIFCFIFLFVAGGFYVYQNFGKETEVNFDLNLNKNSYLPGENLDFSLTGYTSKKLSFIIKFELTTTDGNLINRVSLVENLEENINVQKSILLPEQMNSGTYVLNAIISYGENVVDKKVSVIVKSETSNEVTSENNVVSPVTPPDDAPPNTYVPPATSNPVAPSIANVNTGNLNDEDLFYKSQEVASKSDAVGYCDKIKNNILKTECLSQLSFKFNDEGICLVIEEDMRDYCYVNLISQGKVEVCGLVKFDSSINMCDLYYNYQRGKECSQGNCTFESNSQQGDGDINNLDNYDINSFVS